MRYERVRRSVARSLVLLLTMAIIIVAAVPAYLYLGRSPNGGGTAQQKNIYRAAVDLLDSRAQASQYITEYPVHANADPSAIATDSRGNVWFAIGGDGAIGELNPSNGMISEFRVSGGNSMRISSLGIVVDDSKGLVWFTDLLNNAIWSLNFSSLRFSEYPLPTPASSPFEIAEDGGGNIWFTETTNNKIGEIDERGVLLEHAVPLGQRHNVNANSTGPAGIAIDARGTVWFTEVYSNSVAAFANGKFQVFDLGGRVDSPTGIAIDSFGRLWITQHGPSYISMFDPKTDFLRTISTSIVGVKGTLPYFVLVGSRNEVWFSEHYGNAIGKFIPSNNTLIEYRVPSRVSELGNISGSITLALSSSGQPWFTELYTGKVGTVDISKPVGLGMTVSNSTESVLSVPSGGNKSIRLSVSGGENVAAAFGLTVGASSGNFTFRFSPSSGSGDFGSTLQIFNWSTKSGPGSSYSVTISVITEDLVVSRVLSIQT